MTQDLRAALEANFGHPDFRPYQRETIGQVLRGQDTLGVLPTGAGKSLCYQLPALLLPRPTLVISPLIALMQDQLDGLPEAVYPQATLINSSLDSAEIARRISGIEAGAYRLIYAAPERLRQQDFLHLLQRVGLSLVVVDEAHCVSVWGHDFRPDYLFIRKALELLEAGGPPPTLLALTATATAEMQIEIGRQLGRTLEPITASVFRPNLRLDVFPCANANEKMWRLTSVCRETPGAGIVYANSRDRCESLAAVLNRQGISAAFYHAGLDRESRRAVQQDFMLGRTRVMVATVAFGMGVDKSNVRFVAHFTMPESLEAYTQEAGRAGRDGKPSRCVLLFTRSDIANLNRWKRMGEATLPNVRDTYRALKARIGYGTGSISPDELRMAVFGEDSTEQEHGVRMRVSISLLERSGLVSRHLESGQRFRIEIPAPPPGSRALLDSLLEVRRQKEDERVGDMLAYSDGAECRHLMMARHFDQSLERCGDACDRCRGTALSARAVRLGAPTSADVPDVGRVVLEFAASLPFALHRTGYAKALTGAADSPVAPNKCAHHGTLAGCTLKSVRRFADDLIAGGLLSLNRDAEYTLHLTEAGRAALTGEVEILPNPVRSTLSTRPVQSAIGAAIPSAPLEPQLDSNDDDRFERLRAWRRIEALQRKLAPYVIFHDSTLRAIAMTNPTSEDALRNVTGIGPHKLETYGPAVLALLQGNPLTQSEPEIESPIAGY